MRHGNSLTDHEKGMIDAFEKDGHSQREITKKINRSRCAVNNYIKNKNKTPQKIPGRPEKLSPRNKRAIMNLLMNQHSGWLYIKDMLLFDPVSRTFQA